MSDEPVSKADELDAGLMDVAAAWIENCSCDNKDRLRDALKAWLSRAGEKRADEVERLRSQLAAHEAAAAKAREGAAPGFASEEEWLRVATCGYVGQNRMATVEAIGYAMAELDRLRLVMASQSRELAELRDTKARLERELSDLYAGTVSCSQYETVTGELGKAKSEMAAKDAELARLRKLLWRVHGHLAGEHDNIKEKQENRELMVLAYNNGDPT